MSVALRRGTLGRAVETVTLENEILTITLLVNKGAEIYELRYRPAGVDVLWKSPWGLRDPGYQLPSSSSSQSWLDAYGGGWQVLFPSGAGPADYKGAEMPFHGEASLAPWTVESAVADDVVAEVRLAVRLVRSPFRMERVVRVEAGQPWVTIRERIVNEGGEPIDYMWGHHPAFGAPFLSGACVIDTGARSLTADDTSASPFSPIQPSQRIAWPMAGDIDLARVPGPDEPRAMVGYLGDFESGWYAITNPDLGFGVGLVWPADVLPHAWLWQEMHATSGFPWFKSCYVMAIEPNTSIPAQGLQAVMSKTGTHRVLGPGEEAELDLRAVFFESSVGVERIAPSGEVTQREGGGDLGQPHAERIEARLGGAEVREARPMVWM